MFRDMGFGQSDPMTELSSYTSPFMPASVAQFLGGSYVNGAWSQPTPDDEIAAPYVGAMQNTITEVLAAYSAYQVGDPVLMTAQQLFNDLTTFNDYITLKNQVESAQTSQQSLIAQQGMISTYYGSFTTYTNVMQWLSDQANAATQQNLMTAASAQSGALSQIEMAKFNFYTNEVVPLASHFTPSQQQFLQSLFITTQDGSVTLPDLVTGLQMISPYLSLADLAPVGEFGPQMILGPSLGSSILSSTATSVPAQAAAITSQYQKVVAQLGSWLPSSTQGYFNQLMVSVNAGITSTDGSDTKVLQSIMQGIGNAIASGIGGAGSGSNASAISQAISATQSTISNAGLTTQEASDAEAMANQAVASTLGSSGWVLLAAAGVGLYLFFRD